MSRKRQIVLGMVNISTHPHSAASYVSLFGRALKKSIKMGGEQRAMLGTCSPIGSDPLDGLQGSIFRYTNIDMDAPWLNTLTGKEVGPDEIQEKVVVPDELRPNFSVIWYNFFPREHKLVFELERNDPTTKKHTSFSASTCQKFFQKLLSMPEVKNGLTTVEVTIVQHSETLKQIFGLKRLDKLEIFINRPNANDDLVAEDIERQFEDEGMNRFYQELISKEKTGLRPSERTKALAKIALSEGYVEGSGISNEGQKTTLKTVLKPVESVSVYSPKEQGFGAAFLEAATKLLKSTSW